MTEVPMVHGASAQWQTATVVAIRNSTPRIRSFIIEVKNPFSFTAGQHVDLRLTAEDGYSTWRSYSIGSSPTDPSRIELSIERLDDGEVSPFFHDVVETGDEIELRGPLGGHFVWRPADGGPLLLIGGGSGVVPLMAMIRHRQATAAAVEAVLLLSARTWNDVPYRDELLEFDKARNGFALALSLTRGTPRRAGDYGRRVDAAMIGDVLGRLSDTPKYVFICGANPFVNAAADAALALRIPQASIRTERYGT